MTSEAAIETRFVLDDATVRSLASSFGTPLYVIDEAHLRARARLYNGAFQSVYEETEVAYASKANSILAVLAILADEGCLIDVASEGELRAALLAGVPADRIHFHGNAKTKAEIEFTVSVGVAEIIVDNFEEIEVLRSFSKSCPDVSLRLAPGVDPKTNLKISTGQADTKFGFNIAAGSAERALLAALGAGLKVVGFHCHVGSQLLDPSAQIAGASAIAKFACEMNRKHGFSARVLNFGGGMGIRYEEDKEPVDVEAYCAAIVNAALDGLGDSGLRPTFVQEPGRWLVGESGVTIYRVNNVKDVPDTRRYVVVDGGLSDNPRPALYGSPYPVRWIASDGRSPSGSVNVRVSGKHCETDTLFDDKKLPENVAAGDFLQVLCTGAYNSSMASNYNRYPRPATVLLRKDGSQALVQEREPFDEMFARERLPEDLA